MTSLVELVAALADAPEPEPWAEGDNIPWNDPAFSERMLREHLSQAHGAASRRAQTIARQVAWIDDELLTGPSRILDLGCGPGLYTSRLAARGHRCLGVDFSPASIAHAESLDDGCTYVCADLREADFGRDHDLAMLLYGEANVFRPADLRAILRAALASLGPGGALLLEPSTPAAVEAFGRCEPTWSAKPRGLFSDAPHLYLTQSHWRPDSGDATRRYFVIDAATGEVERFAQTLHAWTHAELTTLLSDLGFVAIADRPAIGDLHQAAAIELSAVIARKPCG